jgi:hypothetical protein
MTAPTPAPPPPRPATPQRVAATLLWLAALLVVIVGALGAAERLGTPIPATTVEAQPIHGMMRVASGGALYDDWRDGPPWAPLSYGALFYWVPGMAARVAGGTAMTALVAGRAFTVLGAVAASALLVLIARQRGHGRATLALVALAPLVLAPLWKWIGSASPDYPAVALSLLGWWLAGVPREGNEPGARRWARVAGAGLVWALVFHVKPTVLAGPAAFAAEWLWRGRWREVAVAAAVNVAGALAGAVVLNLATGGLWKLNAVDSMALSGFAAANTLSVFKALGVHGLLLAVVVAGLGAACWKREPAAFAALGLLAVQAVFLSKRGGDANYLLGFCAVAGVALAGLTRRMESSRVVVCGALAVALLAGLPSAWKSAGTNWAGEANLAAVARQVEGARNLLVLDPNWGMMNGHAVPYADGYHLAILAQGGAVDLAPLIAQIRSREHDLVVANLTYVYPMGYQGVRLAPPELVQALTTRYEPVEDPSGWVVVFQRRR